MALAAKDDDIVRFDYLYIESCLLKKAEAYKQRGGGRVWAHQGPLPILATSLYIVDDICLVPQVTQNTSHAVNNTETTMRAR